MARRSAGLVLYRRRGDRVEVLLAHPGGPFWARRDAGAWSIPKGEYPDGETPLAAARREAAEELGAAAAAALGALPDSAFTPLGAIRQKAGKTVMAFAAPCEIDAESIASNLVTVKWPPRSGRRMTVPEVDRAAWFGLDEARIKINPAQAELLDRLQAVLAEGAPGYAMRAKPAS